MTTESCAVALVSWSKQSNRADSERRVMNAIDRVTIEMRIHATYVCQATLFRDHLSRTYLCIAI